MSHVTKLKTVIKARDMGALKRACEKLGFTFLEDKTTFVSYQPNQRCAHAIDVPGAKYQIGICEETDGTFSVRMDNYTRGGLTHVISQSLMDRFSAEKVRSMAINQGYSVIEGYDEQKHEIVMKLSR